MRILFLSNLYPPHFLGGYELLCEEVAKLLVGRGHEITVLTSMEGNGGERHREDANGVQVLRRLKLEVPFAEPYRFRIHCRIQTARRNARLTREALKEVRPDVVLAWSQLRLTLSPVREVQRIRAPLAWAFNDANIMAYRDRPMSNRLRSRLRWWLSRLELAGGTIRGLDFRHSTSISEILKTELIAGGLPPTIRLIPQGIEVAHFLSRKQPGSIASPMMVCYAGQVHPYKGVHTAVQAIEGYVKLHGKESIQLTIVGDGPADYLASLGRKVAEGDLPVTFLPRVPREELPAIYRRHDVLVFPSIWKEPFGLTHLEAMACGLVVVSTTEGGQREFLRHEENCLTFPANDDSALCGCLDRLRKDSSLAAKLARNGNELVRRDYTTERYAEGLHRLLTECVAAQKTSNP